MWEGGGERSRKGKNVKGWLTVPKFRKKIYQDYCCTYDIHQAVEKRQGEKGMQGLLTDSPHHRFEVQCPHETEGFFRFHSICPVLYIP